MGANGEDADDLMLWALLPVRSGAEVTHDGYLPSSYFARPQTNVMVERVNGRISDVLATRRYGSDENLSRHRVYLLEHTDEH